MWNNCMIIFFHATKNRHKNNKLKSGVIKLSYVQFPLKMKSLSYTFFFKNLHFNQQYYLFTWFHF